MDKRERVRLAVTAEERGCRIKPCSPSEKNCACGRFADTMIAAYEAALAEERSAVVSIEEYERVRKCLMEPQEPSKAALEGAEFLRSLPVPALAEEEPSEAEVEAAYGAFRAETGDLTEALTAALRAARKARMG